MKILIEHPTFCPYQEKITGGTELFVHRILEALTLLGHDVTVFGTADSTLPCIKSQVYSRLAGKGALRLPLWYKEIAQISKDYDVVILNQSFTSETLMRPQDWYENVIYFNHNASGWFTTGLGGGIKLIHNLKLLRLMGGKSFCFSEKNWNELSNVWNDPIRGARVRRYHDRAATQEHWEMELFDGKFNQAVFPHDAINPRAPEGYLVAIGRQDPDKRLNLAEKKAKDLGKELFVLTDMPHDEVMEVLAGADCLLLPSRNETFSIACFEALCHGVPVSVLEVPPALELCPELARDWGDVQTNSYEERARISKELREKYSLEALGRRLELLL